jgi:hypothetical protein
MQNPYTFVTERKALKNDYSMHKLAEAGSEELSFLWLGRHLRLHPYKSSLFYSITLREYVKYNRIHIHEINNDKQRINHNNLFIVSLGQCAREYNLEEKTNV